MTRLVIRNRAVDEYRCFKINMSNPVKIRCETCALPFWSAEQLEKHASTHKRRKTFQCTHCRKGFARADRLKMHERSCDQNPAKEKVERKSFLTLQIGRGANETFRLLESALAGVLQVWRYDFSDEEDEDIYESLHSVVMNDAHDLVIEATGIFKWYLGLKVVFHKAIDPSAVTDPPAYFQTEPFASYHKYDDDVWDTVKGHLEQQIENYETNGSGWVLSQFVSLDVTFAEMDNPLQKVRKNSKGASTDEESGDE